MGKPPEGGGLRPFIIIGILVLLYDSHAQEYGCPPQEKILPCRCSTRDMEFQIWCSHSELPRVLEGLKAVSRYVSHPIDELILENNNLPSLPGHVFASLRVLRLMLRNNRLERVSSGWLDGLHDSLLELFLVEPDLRSLPADSLENLQGLEAVTLQSKLIKRLPSFTGLSKLRYLQINSPGLIELTPRNFRDLPFLEQLHVFGSPKLTRFEAGLLRDLPRLQLVNVSDCGLQWIHPRAFINLPELKELALPGNLIQEATMVGRAIVDIPSLSVLQLDRNKIVRLAEGSFADLPTLSRISLSFNRITEIFPGAFERVPLLRVLNLNHNRIHRIHPEFFVQHGREVSGVEEMWLMDNDIGHVSEIRSVLDATPRLKLLEASFNQIEDIGYGALRGHPSLERLHLDYNRLSFLQRDVFADMPALRELRLRNNSLVNSPDAPFWDLPALKGLDLSGNFFRHVEARLLANLPNLRRLDLSENTIALVEPDAFLNLPALEHINMSGNALSVLHPMTFRHLTNLYELDVGWNRLLEIIPGLPRNMEHLYLPMNRIVALPSNLDSQSLTLPLLRSLDLSANGIERLVPSALGALPSLRKLNLGFNALTILEDGSFEGLMRLELLDLKYNRIDELHARCFRPLRNLLDLNLRGNRIELIKPDVFQDNVRLQRLDISRNNLAQIPHKTFAFTRELRELYASHNALPELPSSLHGLEALQILDLSFNKLTALAPETLSSLTSLLELKLVRNRIRELREGAFDRLPRLALIDLENNDLVLIERNAIRALPELQALRLGKNRIQMIPSGAFSELPMLQSAELQENRVQEIANNAFINIPHLLLLNLSHNLLSSLEHMGLESLHSLEVLDLSDNRITRVSSESLATMEWLVELKMDNNRICIIQGSPFDEMPRLRVLSLRSNKMASVAENTFKRLRSNIAVLDIDGNPLSCSCGMLWLRGWLQQASSEGPRCADGSLFREIRLSKQDCQRERQLEPLYPGCESEGLSATSTSISPHYSLPSWMDMKKPSRLPAQDSDYSYNDYDDYPQEGNSTDISNALGGNVASSSPSPSSVMTVGPQATGHNVQVARPTSPSKSLGVKNVTAAGNRKPTIPPSPSSSGFTFFGVPLPNLNFNLWGNAAKKANRKEDSNDASYSNSSKLSVSSRPGRSRYRNFLPTEPEIHRGGFVPLPRGQGGFIPIVDPRLEQRPFNVNNSDTSIISKNSSKENENGSQMLHERKHIKTSNYNLGKIERTNGPVTSGHNHSLNLGNAKSRQPDRNREKFTGAVSIRREPNSGSTITQDSSVEAHETLVSTEIYVNESIEGIPEDEENKDDRTVSRIVWESDKTRNVSTTIKEVPIVNVDKLHSNINNTSNDRISNNRLKATTMPTTMITTTQVIIKIFLIFNTFWIAFLENIQIMQETSIKQADTSTPNTLIAQTLDALNLTPQVTRSMEASALSALLVPGGQLPPVTVSGTNIRQFGRSTITKIPSPYFEPNNDNNVQEKLIENRENLLSKEDNHLSGSSVDETVKLLENDNFNWYFQHYNDSNLEPYVGIIYGGNLASSVKVDHLSMFVYAYYLIRYLL
ncbi:PREDICTED: chaoptin [Ceratosolen solmsi marchali]|uniref:Chaoptin n=1 Tax=Ceratosolen solmsi marchali TaxID=326594 RepID=A0AAJ7DXZ8_9HYME|nr:PREDICTED: chaoptin [Ceratosolen solmsi marchali]